MKTMLQAPSTATLTVATAVVALLAALMLGLLAPAWADPMRPLNPPPAAASTAAPPTAGTTPANTPTAPAWPPLLALRQDSDGRHQALFGERWVGVGERLSGTPGMGDATATVVTAIDGHSVQLRQGRQRHTLHLLPPLRYSALTASASVPASAPLPSPPGSTRAPGR